MIQISPTANAQASESESRRSQCLRIAVTGSSGLVGTALCNRLTADGHHVVRVRRKPLAADEVAWDPNAAEFDASALDGCDAVVHLAGENIASARWSSKVKDRIRTSRVQGTHILAKALAKLKHPPATFVSASAIGYYGHRGDEVLDEDKPAGSGFLAETARDWEAATQPAVDAGIRVVKLRFGVILSPLGGALANMLLPFRLGVGGRIGDGRQWWSWVSLDDAVGAVLHALEHESISGPVNVTAPQPSTNADFTRALGRALKRPTIAPMPGFAARLLLGEMADALLLASIRVEPRRLLDSSYRFRHADIDTALAALLRT